MSVCGLRRELQGEGSGRKVSRCLERDGDEVTLAARLTPGLLVGGAADRAKGKKNTY